MGERAAAMPRPLERDSATRTAYSRSPTSIRSSRVRGAVTTPAYDTEQREKAEELLGKARDEMGVDAKLHVLGSPSVGRGLHETAETLGADLLVVGSAGRGVLGRIFVSDDTRAALNGASSAVAITPAGHGPGPSAMREIGVGYDGSPESEYALRVARGARSRKARRALSVRGGVTARVRTRWPWTPDEDTYDELVERARERVAGLEASPRTQRTGCRPGAGDLQRLARPSRDRVAQLRPARTARAWQHRAASRTYRALPAACAHAGRSAGSVKRRPRRRPRNLNAVPPPTCKSPDGQLVSGHSRHAVPG